MSYQKQSECLCPGSMFGQELGEPSPVYKYLLLQCSQCVVAQQFPIGKKK